MDWGSAETYESSNTKHTWKKKEVALLILGSSTDDIQTYRQRRKFDAPSIFTNIILNEALYANVDPLFLPFLHGRAV